MKKIIAMILALVMVASFATVSFAEETEGVIELTVDSLGLAAQSYSEGKATVNEIEFEFVQMGNYGDGLQMRDKDGKTSILWNNVALPSAITKIELTYSSTKEVSYANADCVIFSFGEAADALTEEVKLSTVVGEKSYTIEVPEGEFTFFKMEHDLGFTLYWDSIKIYCGDVEAPGIVDDNVVVGGSGTKTCDCTGATETVLTLAADCTEWGCKLHICDECGATYATDYQKALGHKLYDELWEVAKEATATEDGVMEQECLRCHEIQTKVIPALGAPETTAPVAPETTVAPAPETTVAPAPETTAPVAPETTAPVAPETTAPVAPETTAPVAPETTAPVAPETTAPVAPETTAPVAPETTVAPSVPETTVPVGPGEDVAPTGDSTMLFVVFALMTMAAPAALVLKKKHF